MDAEVEASDERAEDVEDLDTERVNGLIEELNMAIDGVNVLEDEAQSCRARHIAAAAALRCSASVLEAESMHWPWSAAAASAFEAARSMMRAHRHQVTAEKNLAGLSAEQAELHAAGAEGRSALTSRLAASRNGLTAATKALTAARKAASAAASRQEKARRALQRAHALESAKPHTGLAMPPLEEELAILERRLSLAADAEAAVAAETIELAEMERRKEEAASRVSDAMLALEEMSNGIHARRSTIAGEAEELAEEGSGPPGHGSSAESGGDSDFVVDSESSGDEKPSSMATEAVTPSSARAPKRGRPDSLPTAERRTPASQGADEAEAESSYLATRTAITRLLRRASELVGASPTLTTTPAPLPSPWHAGHHKYRIETAWYGVAWSDPASMARLRGERSLVETQEI